MVCHCMYDTGDDRRNPFRAKDISSSVAGAQSYAQRDVCCNPSYVQIQDGRQSMIDETYSLMKISGLERRVKAYSMAQSRLAYE